MRDLPEVILLDESTGRIAVRAASPSPKLTGKWRLSASGTALADGQFAVEPLSAGGSREYLLSVELPDLPPDVQALLHVDLFSSSPDPAVSAHFVLPPPARLLPPPAQEFFTGVRFDAAQAIISSGKLSAVIDVNGLLGLFCSGDPLLLPGSRPVWTRGGILPDALRAAGAERMKLSRDRFSSDGKMVECHALALPARMELDELEYTQKFTPMNDGSLRMDLEFVVPECFTGLPRLGVELLLAREMTLTGHLGGSLIPVADLPSGDRIRRLDFRHTVTGRHLTIRAGHEFGFSLLPWSELSLADAAERGTAPAEESVRYLYLDFRDARYGKPVRGGVYRATLFFCGDQPPPLPSGIPSV